MKVLSSTKASLKIGFAGMTHLGLVSAICTASKGCTVYCFDQNIELIHELTKGNLPISEPGLTELFDCYDKNLIFITDSKQLGECEIVYIAPDIPTNDYGKSDLSGIEDLINLVFLSTSNKTIVVILSQVPPGFTRKNQKVNRLLYYQVETLIFGRAVERATYPERIIIGSSQSKDSLAPVYLDFIHKFNCPVLVMSLESAELAKISINMFLVASVSTTNMLAEICEKINANWDEIIPALKLDKRIGNDAYLKPGLGISGGNLERDLATVLELAQKNNTFAKTVNTWIDGSQHRKSWPMQMAKKFILDKRPTSIIALWGLAYKENTHSIKNSAAISTVASLKQVQFKGYDPAVASNLANLPNLSVLSNPIDVLSDSDALMILTPWAEFKEIPLHKIAAEMKGNLIFDPYQLFDINLGAEVGLQIIQLGKAAKPFANL